VKHKPADSMLVTANPKIDRLDAERRISVIGHVPSLPCSKRVLDRRLATRSSRTIGLPPSVWQRMHRDRSRGAAYVSTTIAEDRSRSGPGHEAQGHASHPGSAEAHPRPSTQLIAIGHLLSSPHAPFPVHATSHEQAIPHSVCR